MARQAETGDLSQRVEVNPFTEIGQIGGFYNQVVHAQEKLTTNLESRVNERTRQLQRAKLEAESASRSKSEFLVNMSHEFRTPLNAILGFAAMIEGAMVGPIERKYQEYASDIQNSGKHLMELLSDILDLSKVEAGKLDIDEQEVDVVEVITNCADMVRLRVEEAQLIMTTEFPPELPTLYADRRRLSQVLVNLMTNAIKFTAPGGRIGVSAQIGGNAGIVIAVSDTGIGIAEEDIPKVLEKFGQVRFNHMHAHEGTGLGLAVANALMELHGGTLRIISDKGVGTTVTVIFPPERSNLSAG